MSKKMSETLSTKMAIKDQFKTVTDEYSRTVNSVEVLFLEEDSSKEIEVIIVGYNGGDFKGIEHLRNEVVPFIDELAKAFNAARVGRLEFTNPNESSVQVTAKYQF